LVKKSRRGKGRWRIWAALALAALVTLALWMDASLRPIITSMAQAQCRALAVGVLNPALSGAMGVGVTYGDLISVRTDNAGRVSMLEARTAAMNQLARNVRERAQSGLQQLGVARINIPLGAVLGSRVLAGSGPQIPVKVYPVGSVSTNYQSEFEQSGINQTRHKLFLQVTTIIQIVIPTQTNAVTVTENMLIAESIIVGEVPQSFFTNEGGWGGVSWAP
jgi:sporulation protein YunB